MSLGGFRYALILVDVTTHYTWLYGLTTLTSSEIISALEAFVSDAGAYPRKFHADFDNKSLVALHYASSTNTAASLLHLLVDNLPMVLSNPLGKLSSGWHWSISWKNKSVGKSGTLR